MENKNDYEEVIYHMRETINLLDWLLQIPENIRNEIK